MSLAVIIFAVSAGLMLHTYLLYPLTLRLLPRRFRKPPDTEGWEWPQVAILIPAYNEEKVIAAKIENSLALEYDRNKLEILIGSDGSRDETNRIVQRYQDRGVKLVELPGRSGKTGVLNRLVNETTAEIVVFTDANVEIASDALRKVVRHFRDSKVGVAGGGKYIRIPFGATVVQGERIYANVVNRLKQLECEVGGMSGGLGSMLAMRKSLYQSYAPGSLNDDTVPSIWATLNGFRNVYDAQARAFEDSGASMEEEFRRRIRIGAGNFQTLFRYAKILLPIYGIAAYTFFSHKVIRWIFPFLMIIALISNFFVLDHYVFRWTLLGQMLIYGGAFAGWLFDQGGVRVPVLSLLYHFVALNFGLLLGFFVYLRGIRTSAWEPTKR